MRTRTLLETIIVAALCAVSAQAQSPAVHPLSPADFTQLSAHTREAIARLGDSVRAAGLPDQPLYAKAAEGILKQASEIRILTVVRALARDLGEARESLGANADEAELVAAASLLHIGAPPTVLRRLNAARSAAGQHGESMSLAEPLVALVDLMARGVPATIAEPAIDSLVTKRAPSTDFAALRAAVQRDIAAGRSPEASMAARTQTLLRNIESRQP